MIMMWKSWGFFLIICFEYLNRDYKARKEVIKIEFDIKEL
jgi:hypothetical protein